MNSNICANLPEGITISAPFGGRQTVEGAARDARDYDFASREIARLNPDSQVAQDMRAGRNRSYPKHPGPGRPKLP